MRIRHVVAGVAGLTVFAVLAGAAYGAANRPTVIQQNLAAINKAYAAGDKAALDAGVDALQANLGAALQSQGEKASPATTSTSVAANVDVTNGVFVSTDGNDSNPGSKAAPLKTLNKAQSVASGGDSKVIFVRSGTYAVNNPIVLDAADSNVTWTGYPGEVATIDANGKDAFQLKGTTGVGIENLTFKNVARGVALVDNAVGTKVLWNNFTNCALNCVGINYFSKNSLVENNTMSGGGTGVGDQYGRPLGTYHAAIYIGFSSSGNTVARNSIGDYGSTAITIADGSASEVSSNNTIDRNVIKNVSTALHDSGGIYVLDRGQSAVGNVISNNFIDGVGYDMNKAIYLDDGASNISVTGNVCRNCGQYAIQYHGGKNLTVANNVFDITNSSKVGYYQNYAGDNTAPGLMTDNTFANNVVYSAKTFPSALWDFDNRYGGTTVEIKLPSLSGNQYVSPGGAPQNSGPIVDSAMKMGNADIAKLVTVDGKGPLAKPSSFPAR